MYIYKMYKLYNERFSTKKSEFQTDRFTYKVIYRGAPLLKSARIQFFEGGGGGF